MYSPNQPKRFTYSVQSNSTDSYNELFLGRRTIISRLSTAIATQGQILPITPPFPNASYALQFYGPTVQCEDAHSSVATTIDSIRDQAVSNFTGNIVEGANYYFAFVPDLSNLGNGPTADGVIMVPQI
jgi:hypothetical protein